MRIRHSPGTARETLAAVIARAGYRARTPGRDPKALRRAEERRALWRLSLAAFAMMHIMMLAWPAYADHDGSLDWDLERLRNIACLVITVPVLLFSSGPIFRAAWHGIAARSPGMDVPVALGILVSFIASLYGTWSGGEVYYDSITMFVFFLLTGRYFEARALSGTVDAADSLAQLLPRRAWRLTGEERVETDPAALAPGDLVSIPAGEAAPADATVVSGATEFDESLLTGETYPVQKAAGSLCGSVQLLLAGGLCRGVSIGSLIQEVAISASQSLLELLFAAGDAGDVDSFGLYLHEVVVVHAPAGRELRSWGCLRAGKDPTESLVNVPVEAIEIRLGSLQP